MVEYPKTCPKCGVVLEEGKDSKDPTWVSPYQKKTSERTKLNEMGRFWCRKCAVECITPENHLYPYRIVHEKGGTRLVKSPPSNIPLSKYYMVMYFE